MAKPDIFGAQEGQNASFVSFDELENAFKTPTQYQHFYENPGAQAPQGEPSGDLPPGLVDPDGSANEPDEAQPVVDHDHAMRTGERIARLIDTGIDFTLSNLVARNGESYRADERDLHDIAEAWGEMAEDKGWSIGPEWSLAILYLMVYGPLVKQALYDRRMAQLEERMAQLEAAQKAQTIQMNPQKPDNDAEPKPSAFTHHPAAEATGD